MSKVELEAVKKFKTLRGDRPCVTYMSTDKYGSAATAKSKLALAEGDTPEVRVKVLVKNDPKTIKRDKVRATADEPGGGVEYFTEDSVSVKILDIFGY